VEDKKIIMSIIGEQVTPDGDTNRMEMVTEGRYYERDGMKYLEYEENETSGLGGTTTTLTIGADIVSLMRRGRNTTHMVFKEGKKSYNIYNTPMGSMEMGVWPTNMEINIGEEKGDIALEYELDIGGQYAGANMISVVYRSKTDGQPQAQM
jgi:uncharacterized beta-barrel protein YwiB (DUF1934 family)